MVLKVGGCVGRIWGIQCTTIHISVKFERVNSREAGLEVKSSANLPGSIQMTPTLLPASTKLLKKKLLKILDGFYLPLLYNAEAEGC